MRIASRLVMHQCLGRGASMLLPAGRVARRLQPGYRVARPQYSVVLHPECGAIPVAPIIQPLPLYRAVKQASNPIIAMSLPLVNSDRVDQLGLSDAVNVPA